MPRKAVAALGALFIVSLVATMGMTEEPRPRIQSCATSGTAFLSVDAPALDTSLPHPQGSDTSSSLSPAAKHNAAVIIATGQSLKVPPLGIVTALVASLQESSLGTSPGAMQPNGDGDLGAFQMRGKVGWYADGATVEANTAILQDVAYAAKTFYLGHDVGVYSPTGAGPIGYHIPGLANVPNWQTMDPGDAAVAVERPAAQYRYRYAQQEATAVALLKTIDPKEATATGTAESCTSLDTGGTYSGDISTSLKGLQSSYEATWMPYEGNATGDPGHWFAGECVSWAGYFVRQSYPKYKDFNNRWHGYEFGNANTWDSGARGAGIPIDQTPAVGAVAQSNAGRAGHVAVVIAVHPNGTIQVAEYNYGHYHTFGIRDNLSASSFDNYIHFEK